MPKPPTGCPNPRRDSLFFQCVTSTLVNRFRIGHIHSRRSSCSCSKSRLCSATSRRPPCTARQSLLTSTGSDWRPRKERLEYRRQTGQSIEHAKHAEVGSYKSAVSGEREGRNSTQHNGSHSIRERHLPDRHRQRRKLDQNRWWSPQLHRIDT